VSGRAHAARAFLRRAATLPIRAYRRWLSPLKPPMCRFRPTCSQYAIEAVETHGLVRGTALAVWRLLRCQPFAKGGWDPVPPRRGAGAGDGEDDEGGAA
jgi:putative membrane protein insertion efficiency factor